MRRTSYRISKQFTTAVPAVAEFWNVCVANPHLTGPNTALALTNKVANQLTIAARESDNVESFNGGGPSAAALTKNDALLHASVAARVASTSSSSSNGSSSSSSSTALSLPEFIYRRKTRDIANEAEKIFNAYEEYYNHIKFRNGWEKPQIAKGDDLATEMKHEAADIAARIRARLDEENPVTKLRQADGSAQTFFNSEDAGKLFLKAKEEAAHNDTLIAAKGSATAALPSHFNRREFVKTLVLFTFKDAMGFVEGLTKAKIERYFNDLSDFGFNPSAHVQHLLLEMLAHSEVSRMTFDFLDAIKYRDPSWGIVPQQQSPKEGSSIVAVDSSDVNRKAFDRARQSRDNEHFCEDGGNEDKLWRDAIGKLYKAHDALLLAVTERKRNAVSLAGKVSVIDPPVSAAGKHQHDDSIPVDPPAH